MFHPKGKTFQPFLVGGLLKPLKATLGQSEFEAIALDTERQPWRETNTTQNCIYVHLLTHSFPKPLALQALEGADIFTASISKKGCVRSRAKVFTTHLDLDITGIDVFLFFCERQLRTSSLLIVELLTFSTIFTLANSRLS